MKIDSSTIGMESVRNYQSVKTTVRRFEITAYQGQLTGNSQTLNGEVTGEQNDLQEDNESVSEQKKTALEEWEARFRSSVGRVQIRNSVEDSFAKLRELTIRYIFDLLFGGHRVSDSSFGQVTKGSSVSMTYQTVNLTEETYQWESEETAFSTLGTVRTSDGREINFNVNVGMSREFGQIFGQNLQISRSLAGVMCDPLVINLDTDVASLSDQKIYFDLDADGEMDEISRLGSGSGYLALDQNEDGIINDGSELFGTKSGDGFRDLARFDEDGNGWIDENDEVWSKLQIWCLDEQGNTKLYRLAEKGVGAICLQNVDTDFTLKGGDGQTRGAIRRSGVFLYEDGNVGTIQHVDLAK